MAALVHHELCFGCGRTNLFGLLLEVEQTAPDVVAGRCFIKQDHQGADRGTAHEGVLAAALSDAMALACGPDARPARIEIELSGPGPVGGFLQIEARARPTGQGMLASANASFEGRRIAHATGHYRR